MELRVGYKQTEAGVIPEEWDFSALGELISEMRGGAPLSPSDFKDSGVKVLPKGGVGRTGWLQMQDSEMQFCSPQYARAHRRNQVDETFTIVVLRDLVPSGPSIGLMVKIREPETYVLAQGVYGFKTSDRVDPGYLVQLSNTNWYRKLANSIMVGSTQVHITNTAFKRARVPLPTKTEQQAIAEALSDADALIESLDQLIAKKRQIKQGAMQELLTGKRRLPGFGGEWRSCRLGEVIASCSGGATPYRGNPEYYKGNVKWISSGELNYNVIFDSIEHISETAVENANLKLHPAGTFLMAITGLEAAGTRGSCGIIGSPATTNQSCMAIYPNSQLNTAFLFHYYVFRGDELALKYCQGTKQQSYTAKLVKLLPIDLPLSLEEQTAIATVLSDMDTELATLESRLAKARQIKQGMMQELLTGRIRLL